MTTKTIAVVRSLRPPFLILTPVCILLGIAASLLSQPEIQIDLVILVLLGALSAHVSANTFNEYFDFHSGLDKLTVKTPFSGGSGALPEYPHAHTMVLAVAVASLLITSVIGIYLVSIKGTLLLALGLTGVVMIVVYTRWINRLPWLCLVSPGFAFGPLFVLGTFICITHSANVSMQDYSNALLLSLVPFFLVNNLLLLNQFPDVDADKAVGRNTFPIQYGLHASIQIYLAFVIFAALAVVVAVLAGIVHYLALLALLPLALGYNVYRGVKAENFAVEKIIPYMGKNVAVTLLTTLVFSVMIILTEVMALT